MATWLERLTSLLHLLPNVARRIFLVRFQSNPKSQAKHLANAGKKNRAAQPGDVDRDKIANPSPRLSALLLAT